MEITAWLLDIKRPNEAIAGRTDRVPRFRGCRAKMIEPQQKGWLEAAIGTPRTKELGQL
jgi:hypothetical protein